MAATLYVDAGEDEAATEKIIEMASFFSEDYFLFLTQQYPSETGRLATANEQQEAAVRLFTELSRATAPFFQPDSLGGYGGRCELEPNKALFDNWIMHVASAINRQARGLGL